MGEEKRKSQKSPDEIMGVDQDDVGMEWGLHSRVVDGQLQRKP